MTENLSTDTRSDALEQALSGRIVSGLSNADYHADKSSYSSSLIKAMAVPAIAKHQMDSPSEYKDCFRIGSAVHGFILEPEKFHAEFLTGIDRARRSKDDKKAWSDWYLMQGWDDAESFVFSNPAASWHGAFEAATGKSIVTPDELKEITLMAESVAANPTARDLLEKGRAEQSVYWTDKETGLSLKCRPDFLNDFCSDLKTCQSAAPSYVSREIFKRGYHVSAAMYSDGLQQVTGEYHPFTFIFVEKTAPYLCAVYSLDDQSQEYAFNQYRDLVHLLATCLELNTWPGYDDNLALSLPGYALGHIDD